MTRKNGNVLVEVLMDWSMFLRVFGSPIWLPSHLHLCPRQLGPEWNNIKRHAVVDAADVNTDADKKSSRVVYALRSI